MTSAVMSSKRSRRGAFIVIPTSAWLPSQWAWGNFPSEASAEAGRAAIIEADRHYTRVLINPATRTAPPPGLWCVIWRDEHDV